MVREKTKPTESTVFYFQGKMCSPRKGNEHEGVTIKGGDGFPGWVASSNHSLPSESHLICHNSNSLNACLYLHPGRTSNECMDCLSILHLRKLIV